METLPPSGTDGTLAMHILGELGFSPAAVCDRSRAATRLGFPPPGNTRKHKANYIPSRNRCHQPTNQTNQPWTGFSSLEIFLLFESKVFFQFFNAYISWNISIHVETMAAVFFMLLMLLTGYLEGGLNVICASRG